MHRSLNRLFLALASALTLAATLPLTAAPRLMQGPMLGHVDEDSAKIWARVAGEAELSIRYSQNPDFSDYQVTEPIAATADNDYCVHTSIESLEAGSFYYYQVLLDGELLEGETVDSAHALLTAPTADMNVKFTIAFGSAAKTEQDSLQAIWLQVQNARPHAFFWLGDNESAEDLPASFQAEQYRKQRDVPFLQPLLRSVPQMATWNGPRNGSPKDFEIFKRYWANPSYGTIDNPGTYFKYNYAGVDFFLLDTYSFRSEHNEATLLGKTQLEWLKSELDKSEASFKVLLSSSSWTDIKSDSSSAWTSYTEERSDLLSYIREREIPGVVLVSGDNDQAEIKAIPMSELGGYDLYELVSSPLAQSPNVNYDEQEPSTIVIHEPYADSMNFGMLSFDMSKDDPSFSYDVINVFGESVFPTLTVNASELTNGISSWQSKVDDPDAYAYLTAEGSTL